MIQLNQQEINDKFERYKINFTKFNPSVEIKLPILDLPDSRANRLEISDRQRNYECLLQAKKDYENPQHKAIKDQMNFANGFNAWIEFSDSIKEYRKKSYEVITKALLDSGDNIDKYTSYYGGDNIYVKRYEDTRAGVVGVHDIVFQYAAGNQEFPPNLLTIPAMGKTFAKDLSKKLKKLGIDNTLVEEIVTKHSVIRPAMVVVDISTEKFQGREDVKALFYQENKFELGNMDSSSMGAAITAVGHDQHPVIKEAADSSNVREK